MAIDYTKLASQTRALIEANGRAVSLVKYDETAADTSKPWRDRDTAGDTTIAATAILVPYEADDTDGSLVRRGDQRCLLAAASAEVSGQDIENFDAVQDSVTGEWKIETVSVIQPGNVVVLYDIQLRQ